MNGGQALGWVKRKRLVTPFRMGLSVMASMATQYVQVAYLRAADNYDGPLAIRLKGRHQPVIRTPKRVFNTPLDPFSRYPSRVQPFNSRSSIDAVA